MLAIVMTPGAAFPSNGSLAQAIKARLPNVVIPSEVLADPKGTLVFLDDDYMFAVGKVDAPCPISKDDPCVQFAWYWPDAWEAVSKHKAHLLASVSGGADARRRAALRGQLVAAVIGDRKPPVAFCVAIKLSRDTDAACRNDRT
jgi:hypothetical protein